MHLQVDLLFCTFKFRLKELSIFEIWNRPLGRFSYRLSYSVGTLYLPAKTRKQRMYADSSCTHGCISKYTITGIRLQLYKYFKVPRYKNLVSSDRERARAHTQDHDCKLHVRHLY